MQKEDIAPHFLEILSLAFQFESTLPHKFKTKEVREIYAVTCFKSMLEVNKTISILFENNLSISIPELTRSSLELSCNLTFAIKETNGRDRIVLTHLKKINKFLQKTLSIRLAEKTHPESIDLIIARMRANTLLIDQYVEGDVTTIELTEKFKKAEMMKFYENVWVPLSDYTHKTPQALTVMFYDDESKQLTSNSKIPISTLSYCMLCNSASLLKCIRILIDFLNIDYELGDLDRKLKDINRLISIEDKININD